VFKPVRDNLQFGGTQDKHEKQRSKETLKKCITVCLYAVCSCSEVYCICERGEHVLLRVKTSCTDTTESERLLSVYMHPRIKVLVLCTATSADILYNADVHVAPCELSARTSSTSLSLYIYFVLILWLHNDTECAHVDATLA
jgi:hypothetical protein